MDDGLVTVRRFADCLWVVLGKECIQRGVLEGEGSLAKEKGRNQVSICSFT